MKHSSEQGEYRKVRKQGAGKGDMRRPTDDKKFRDNYDAINWHRKNEHRTRPSY